ncbi:MAG: formamidopyrimidine-DNA glycosylase [Acidobacteriota bacterium]|nr:formamidopyrimidine-DNA glycosylase [Acidobacteriota bacterium]MDE2964150.1 formamidopyrimidine-DNA glycosylase [Acidobacteriota bacterium]
MPELPDIVVYLESLQARILHQRLEQIRVASPFLIRSVSPRPEQVEGLQVVGLSRMGKRVVIDLEGDIYLVFHLMIAGRFHWKERRPRTWRRSDLAAFDFSSGSLLLTESGSKKRASLHLVKGKGAMAGHDPGGIEPLEVDFDAFRRRLTLENHTLKRSLTDPHILSGIGNAYSDEILHRAQLSPLALSQKLKEDEIRRLYLAVRETLEYWLNKLRDELQGGFPERVTAFREGMAVHGRYRKPCPRCGSPVQRIVYAGNETNYCSHCQTRGKLLADRALSRLLKRDWPRTLEEQESRRASLMAGAAGLTG